VAHAFDTGLAAPQRTLILAGVVTLLASLLKANGLYLHSVIPWGGVIRSWTDTDGIAMLHESLLGRLPAIAVALGDRSSKPAGTGGWQFQSELELLLYFASNNARDITLGRQTIDVVGAAANAADPGLHVMLEHAEQLVIGGRCGASATIKGIRPDREEELGTFDDMTLWLQTYQVTLARTIKKDRSVTQFLDDIRVRVTQEDGEAELPDPKTKETTLDVYGVALPP